MTRVSGEEELARGGVARVGQIHRTVYSISKQHSVANLVDYWRAYLQRHEELRP